MKLIQKTIVLFAVVFLFLPGCTSTAMFHQTEGNIADVRLRQIDSRHSSDALAKPEPALVVNQGLYVDKTPISLERTPSWLRNKIIIRGDQLPFSYYSRTVAAGGGRPILTRYQVGLDPNAKISVNYSGTVKGALDLIASKSGYVYTIRGTNIYWQAFITKSFDIAFMPGSSDYMMGKAASASGSLMTAGGGGGASTTVAGIIDDSSSSQYSNLKGTLSVWKDLEATIKELMSPDGKVITSEATTTITVKDRPSNIELISRFIANMNNNLSKQVLIKVQVLEVQLTSDYTYGINWDIVQNAFAGSNWAIIGNFGTPVTITSLTGGTTPPIYGIQANKAIGNQTWWGALLNALTQQGKVSVVTEPRVVCLNNQVSVIRIASSEGYIASVQNTSTGGGGTSTAAQNTVTSQITPGTLITGLTLYVLPKIMNNKIYLQVNADLSNKVSLQAISSTTGTTPGAASTAPIIQVPKVTQKQFNQRSMIKSGDTLVLSGFRQVSNQTGAMQFLDSQNLGGRGASQFNTETIVLITPIILHG
jgi:type IVB pilus formation R64 PilN family outer membrane protein